MALVTKSASPQTIGLECPSPGIVVRHKMFVPVAGFHSSGRSCLSAMPDASGPRKDGQCPVPFACGGSALFDIPLARTMRRASIAG
jgi:hypothetical protein